MNRHIRLSIMLNMVLVLCLAGSAFATTIWTAPASSTEYTMKAGTWVSDPVVVASASGLSNLQFNFDYVAKGSWDGALDKNTTSATMDSMTINVYKDGALYQSYVNNAVDNVDLRPVSLATQNVHLEYLLPNVSGSYIFEAIGGMTARDETWLLTGAEFAGNSAPTPLPAAVWALGSGLIALVGYKRLRANAS